MKLRIFFVLAVLLPSGVLHAGCNPPVAVADSVVNYGATLVVDVLANDRDLDGEALAVEVTGNGCTGVSIVVSGGLLRIEPPSHAPIACSIDYRITDAAGRSATSQVHLVPVVLAPIFADGFELGSPAAWSLVCPSSC